MNRYLALAAVLLFAGGRAIASGGGDDPDQFVHRANTDINLDRYQAGRLGVVLPTYFRSNLYIAWRTVMLGPQELISAPNPAGALAAVEQRRSGGWQDQAMASQVYGAWRAAVRSALQREMAPPPEADALVNSYLNCPLGSYAFATRTLGELAARADATPERLATWVATQRQVFSTCGDDPVRSTSPAPRTPQPLPAPLSAREPLYWRQVQEYQVASAAFYGADYARSTALFDQIGATAGHPLRGWGEYLALRAQGRAAVQVPGGQEQSWQARMAPEHLAQQQQKLAAIEARVARILANPALAARHADARAISRIYRAKFAPVARFAQLGKLLDDPRNDPYLEDSLGDWLMLADRLFEAQGPNRPDPLPSLRAASSLLDWVMTVQQCGQYSSYENAAHDATASANPCVAARTHARAQWQRYAKEGNAAQARVWLFAHALRRCHRTWN
jgi:hypothetical protein